MDIQQVHYTSCRHGSSGHAGFQVRALSDGIDPADLQEVVKHSNYKRPRDWPEGQPLPVCHRLYALPSGRLALSVTHYAGSDYSNREGNLFAHTLLFPPGAMATSPANYFSWDGWKTHLEPDEDLGPPPPLPVLSADDIAYQETYSPAAINAFLQQRDGRVTRLQAMVHALFLAPLENRSLVLRGEAIDNLWWLAAIHHCFPLSTTKQISFSSYESSQIGLPLLTATTAGTELSCNATQRDYQFYCFDEFDGCDSRLPDEDAPGRRYAAQVVQLLTQPPEDLGQLLTFIEQLQCDGIDQDLWLAADLYRLGREQTPADNAERLRLLAEFALRKAPDAVWTSLFEHMGQTLQALETIAPPLYIKLLTKRALNAGKDAPQQREALLSAWQRLQLDELRAGQTSGDAERLRQTVQQALPDGEKTLAAATITHYQTLAEIAVAGETQTAQTLELIERALKTLDRLPVQEQDEFRGWFGYIADQNFERLQFLLPTLLSAADTDRAFLDICGTAGLCDADLTAVQADAFAKVLVDHEPKFPEHALENARTEFPLPLILAEWQQRIDSAPPGVDTFIDHRTTVIDQLTHVQLADYADWLVTRAQAWTRQPQHCLRLAEYFFARDELQMLDPSIARPLLEALSSEIPLDPDADSNKAYEAKLTEVISASEIELEVGTLVLRELIVQAEDGKQKYPITELARNHLLIAGLDTTEYKLLIDRLLGAITPHRFPRVEHIQLVETLMPGNPKVFAKKYKSWLKNILPKVTPIGFCRYIQQWLQKFPEPAKNSPPYQMLDIVRNTAIPILAKKSSRDYQAAVKCFENAASTPSIADFFKKVRSRKKWRVSTLIVRVKSAFIRYKAQREKKKKVKKTNKKDTEPRIKKTIEKRK